MRKILALIIGIVLLVGCKDIVSKMIFDETKLASKVEYSYVYKGEKLVSKTEKSYSILHGNIVDSMIVNVDFVYNKSGLIEKEVSKTSFMRKPLVNIFKYDLNDSLISSIKIDENNDTVSWTEYKYFADVRKVVFRRDLIPKLDIDLDIDNASQKESYDTISYRNEYDFEGNICNQLRQYDNKNKLAKIIRFKYDNDKLSTETHVTFFNSIELVEKTTYYNYSKSLEMPDYYSLDSKNDTLELQINKFEKDILISSIHGYNYGEFITQLFFENNKLSGAIELDRSTNLKRVDLYKYLDNGDLMEQLTYREKIK